LALTAGTLKYQVSLTKIRSLQPLQKGHLARRRAIYANSIGTRFRGVGNILCNQAVKSI